MHLLLAGLIISLLILGAVLASRYGAVKDPDSNRGDCFYCHRADCKGCLVLDAQYQADVLTLEECGLRLGYPSAELDQYVTPLETR